MLYAGIDEAGYGPLLGPLCVGCAAFEVDAEHAGNEGEDPPCLWKKLAAAVCRSPSDKRRRVAVDDSKKLKGTNDGAAHPLRHLERGVTAFQAASLDAMSSDDAPPFASDDELLRSLDAPVARDHWHTPSLPLPVGNDAGQLRIAAARVRTALAQTQTRTLALRVRAITASDFNVQVARVNNKATVNFMAAMTHVDQTRRMAAARGLDAFVALDQHGGRRCYVRPLSTSFPDAQIRVLAESDTVARYNLKFPAGDGLSSHSLTVTFEQGGEERHLPIALASMAAKFARELHMRRLNAFFTQHVPEVKPTAGYYQDGRRFLDDVLPVVQRLGLREESLVRCL